LNQTESDSGIPPESTGSENALEPLKPGSPLIFADCPLSTMRPAHIRVLHDRKALDAPEQAKHRLKALRKFFEWAVEEELLKLPPTTAVKKVATASQGHHTWSPE
jgi:hypothetical protein